MHATASLFSQYKGPSCVHMCKLLACGFLSQAACIEGTCKFQEKREQHKTLSQALVALEVQGFDTRLAILTFGVGGTLYKPTKDALHDIGIKPTEVKRLLKEVHLHS